MAVAAAAAWIALSPPLYRNPHSRAVNLREVPSVGLMIRAITVRRLLAACDRDKHAGTCELFLTTRVKDTTLAKVRQAESFTAVREELHIPSIWPQSI